MSWTLNKKHEFDLTSWKTVLLVNAKTQSIILSHTLQCVELYTRLYIKDIKIFVVMSVNGSVFLLFVFLDELALAVCTYTASILHLFRAYTFKGTT